MASERRYILDIWSDTRDNLDTISKASGISTAELMRRGAECAIILHGVPTAELAKSLFETLNGLRNELVHGAAQEKVCMGLSRAVSLSVSLCAIHIINEGKESRNALQIYSDTLREHLLAFLIPGFELKQKDRETIRTDVDSFLNLLEKIEKVDKNNGKNGRNHK